MSQIDLADASKVSSKTVGRAESGNAISLETSLDLGAALAQKLGIPIDLDDPRKAEALLQDFLLKRALSKSPTALERISIQTLQESGQIGDEGGTINLANLYVTRDCETNIYNAIIQSSQPIFITGEPGSGKTSTLWRIAHRFLQSGRKVHFFRADFLVSDEGMLALSELPVVAEGQPAAYILIDTIDSIISSVEARDRLNKIFYDCMAKGHKIAAACRSIEKARYFPSELKKLDKTTQKIDEEYSESEFVRVVESHVKHFYNLRDVETLAQRVEEVNSIVAGSRPAASIARHPLLLRMLFSVFAPLDIPPEINPTTLYVEYWRKRVECDWRAGKPDPETGSRNLTDSVACLANSMLANGRTQISRHQVSIEASTRVSLTVDVEELVSRGVLQRVSVFGDHDGVQFFHQTFFEFSAAWSVVQASYAVDLKSLYSHLVGNAFDSLRIPVLQYALAISLFLAPEARAEAEQIILDIFRNRPEHLVFAAVSSVAQMPSVNMDVLNEFNAALADRKTAAIYIRLTPYTPSFRLRESWDLFLELWRREEREEPERNPRAVRTAIIREMPRLAARDRDLALEILQFVTLSRIHLSVGNLEIDSLAALLHEVFPSHPSQCSTLASAICETLSGRDQKRYQSLANTLVTICLSKGIEIDLLEKLRSMVLEIDFALVRRAVYQIDALLWPISQAPPYSLGYSDRYLDADFLGISRCWLRDKNLEEWKQLWKSFVAYSSKCPDNNEFHSNWSRMIWDQLGKHPLESNGDFSFKAFEFLADTISSALVGSESDEIYAAKKICTYMKSTTLLREILRRIDGNYSLPNDDQEFADSMLPIRILNSGECDDYSDPNVISKLRRIARNKLGEHSLEILEVWPNLWKQIAGFLIHNNELHRLEVPIRKGELVAKRIASVSSETLVTHIRRDFSSSDSDVRQRAARMSFLARSEKMGISIPHDYFLERHAEEKDPRIAAWLGICCLEFAEEDHEKIAGLKILLPVCSEGDVFVRDKAIKALVRLIDEKHLEFDVVDIIYAISSNVNLSKLHEASRLVASLALSDPRAASQIAEFLLFSDATNALGKTVLASFRFQARIPMMQWFRTLNRSAVESTIQRLSDLDSEIGSLIADIALNAPHLQYATELLQNLIARADVDPVLKSSIGRLIRSRNATIGTIVSRVVA